MNEQNMRPEQVRQAELFQRREELTWEAHRLSQEAPDPELRERLVKYRTQILKNLIDKTYPDKDKAWKERHLRQLLGQPIPVKSASVPKSTAAPAKAKTDSALAWQKAKRFYELGNLENAPEKVRRWCQEEGVQIRTSSAPLTVSK